MRARLVKMCEVIEPVRASRYPRFPPLQFFTREHPLNQMLQIKLFEVQNFQHLSLLRLHVRVTAGIAGVASLAAQHGPG